MHAALKAPRVPTFDADCDADTELHPVARLDGTSGVVPAMRPRKAVAPSARPIFVDKSQLVELIRTKGAVSVPVPAAVARPNAAVREDVSARTSRRLTWLTRFGLVAALGCVVFVATRPVVRTMVEHGCATQGWCAGAHR